MYKQVSDTIEVAVLPEYLEEHSDPDAQHYVWGYTIQIRNLGQKRMQLLNRHWRIVDANGRVEEVHGAGVVGEQPTLKPGEEFAYSSHTVLRTPSGFMLGSYDMIDDKGASVEAAIPAFSLDCPDDIVTIN